MKACPNAYEIKKGNGCMGLSPSIMLNQQQKKTLVSIYTLLYIFFHKCAHVNANLHELYQKVSHPKFVDLLHDNK